MLYFLSGNVCKSIMPVQNLTCFQYQFYDAKGNGIYMKEEMEFK